MRLGSELDAQVAYLVIASWRLSFLWKCDAPAYHSPGANQSLHTTSDAHFIYQVTPSSQLGLQYTSVKGPWVLTYLDADSKRMSLM